MLIKHSPLIYSVLLSNREESIVPPFKNSNSGPPSELVERECGVRAIEELACKDASPVKETPGLGNG